MTEPDDIRDPGEIPHTTPEERDRAEAVHSMSDETRGADDETDLIQGAGGEVRRPDDDVGTSWPNDKDVGPAWPDDEDDGRA